MTRIDYEFLSKPDLEALQCRRLRRVVSRAFSSFSLYQQLWGQAFDARKFRSIEDLTNLPFVTKPPLAAELAALIGRRPRDVARIQSSSGTSGDPVLVPYTWRDLRTWRDLTARILSMAGVTSSDVVYVAFNYGLSTGGIGLHYGAERLRAAVVPAGNLNPWRQVAVMRRVSPSVLLSTPSYAVRLSHVLRELSVDPKSIGFRLGLFGAEPWTDEMRWRIESEWGLVATDNYGLSEVIGPGVAGECVQRTGLHVNEDHFLAEVVDPDTGSPVAEGETGELVLTTLTRQALPLIRYRTGDLSKFENGDCACGRTFRRIGRIIGRADDMMIVNGVNVYPSAIESAVLSVVGSTGEYAIHCKTDENGQTRISIEVEVADEVLRRERKEEVETRFQRAIYQATDRHLLVTVLPKGRLPREVGKAKRVFRDSTASVRGETV